MAETDHSALKRLIDYAAEEAGSSELLLTARLLQLAASSLDPQEIAWDIEAAAEDAAGMERFIGRQLGTNKIFRKEKLQ